MTKPLLSSLELANAAFDRLPTYAQLEIKSKSQSVSFDKDHPKSTARYDYLINPTGQNPQTPFIYFDPALTFLGIERMRSFSEAVNAQQNDPIVATVLMDLTNCVVGAKGGKVKITSSNKKWNKVANDYINNYWSENCDYHNQHTSFNKFLNVANVVSNRDGDCLFVCDTNLTKGKILSFESDQIVNVTDFDELAMEYKMGDKAKQLDGIVFDDYGACIGVIVTKKRQQKSVNNDDALFIPIDSCYLYIAEAYRLNQHRGDSRLLCLLTILSHNRKMIESTILSAQRAAEDIAVKQVANPMSALLSMDQKTVMSYPMESPTFTPIGGGQVTIGLEDKYTVISNPKPETNITEFGNWFRKVVHKRFGLANVFANGEVQNGDQAKAELIISHIAISAQQENISGLIKWVVRKALQHAISNNDLKNPPEEWYVIECIFPDLPTCEFDITMEDKMKKIRFGGSSFKTEFGPEWEDKIIPELIEELKMLKDEGMVDLSVFETVAGKNESMNKQNN